jgi:predicted nucleotidyltransferase
MKVLTAIQAKNSSAGIPKLITRIVKRIVGLFAPEQVILFGSYAKGTAGADSDVDLLVVMPVKGSKRQKIVEIGVALHDFAIAKDIMISTPEDFCWRKDVVGTIEYPAAHEGIVLYGKS